MGSHQSRDFDSAELYGKAECCFAVVSRQMWVRAVSEKPRNRFESDCVLSQPHI